MPESRALSHASSRGDSTRAVHDLQARLAAAEKDVAVALRDQNYDQLIVVSTKALEEKSNVMDKKVIKSRKNLLWARSHAYQHRNLHELALRDAKKALKLDPHDPGSYLRTALMLANAGHSSQAENCLDKACELAQGLDPPTKAEWLRKIQKQRRMLNQGKTSPIDVLPNEVLVQVAQHLDYGDLSAMGQTCRRWRQTLLSIPALWRSVIIKSERLSESKSKSWLQHVEMCTARANNTLESVTFIPPFPFALLDKVLDLLRGSAATLAHLALPVKNQETCYSRLYRYCPRLYSIDCTGCDASASSSDSGDATLPLGDPESLVEPFSLQVFRTDPLNRYSSLVSHMHSLRVLDEFAPSLVLLRACLPNPATGDISDAYDFVVQLLQINAATLEEINGPNMWPHPSMLRQREEISITFPKMVKAALGLCTKLQFHLPNVLDLALDLRMCGFVYEPRLTALLETSPCLQTLKIAATDTTAPNEITAALQRLADLQKLNLEFAGHARALVGTLLPTAISSESGESGIDFRFSKLRQLTLDASRLDLTRLAAALIVRDSLLNGDTLQKAHQASNELLKALSHNTSARTASAFQRGAGTNALPLSNQEDRSPRLDNPHEHSRLVKLCLTGLRELPEDVESALRLTVPELELSYSPL
ncbi:hypothetical protein PANT_6c00074 [Moesziomyces antarcticus T-34]|uniref:F-box domain-containing protein n=1 Tax=Pseudozyma antarctica (strain T-34) TaxID=1151754 RepID=M9MB26_PSEA3|nr:hypothetical protein PANT_6c00074 [Moesziomyces antarcticus T-34]